MNSLRSLFVLFVGLALASALSASSLPTVPFQGLTLPAPQKWKASEEAAPASGSVVRTLEKEGLRFTVAVVPTQPGDDLKSDESVQGFLTGLTRNAQTISNKAWRDFQGRNVLVVDTVRGAPRGHTYSQILAWAEGGRIFCIVQSARHPRPEGNSELRELLAAVKLP